MESFGATASIDDERIYVPEGRYPAVRRVEPDATRRATRSVQAAIAGGRCTSRARLGSLQGDAVFAGMLGDMGCDVHVDDGDRRRGPHGPLRGIDVDMADISDLVPTLAVVAPFATTPTTIRGVSFIRAKESDRIGDLCAELRRCRGRRATRRPADRTGTAAPATFDTHHDHRLAMALGCSASWSTASRSTDPDVVTKSWPGYWEMLDGRRPCGPAWTARRRRRVRRRRDVDHRRLRRAVPAPAWRDGRSRRRWPSPRTASRHGDRPAAIATR